MILPFAYMGTHTLFDVFEALRYFYELVLVCKISLNILVGRIVAVPTKMTVTCGMRRGRVKRTHIIEVEVPKFILCGDKEHLNP